MFGIALRNYSCKKFYCIRKVNLIFYHNSSFLRNIKHVLLRTNLNTLLAVPASRTRSICVYDSIYRLHLKPVLIKHALIESQAEETEKTLNSLQCQLDLMISSSVELVKATLRKENKDLCKVVENLKKQIMDFDASSSVQVANMKTVDSDASTTATKESSVTKEKLSVENNPSEKSSQKSKKKEPKPPKAQPADDLPVDVARLDFRVGQIIAVEKHPDADSLYVEKIDVGEDKPRTVVSGLVKHMPPEDLLNKMVILLCNLKPAKMRGILSESMVMCASTPDKVEVLIPPPNCQPGDLVEFDGYVRKPDSVLNPKKKIFEAVAPDLKTDSELNATYKGVAFVVPGKGVVKAKSLTGVQIK